MCPCLHNNFIIIILKCEVFYKLYIFSILRLGEQKHQVYTFLNLLKLLFELFALTNYVHNIIID